MHNLILFKTETLVIYPDPSGPKAEFLSSAVQSPLQSPTVGSSSGSSELKNIFDCGVGSFFNGNYRRAIALPELVFEG